jgi:hypothetical protein
MVEVSRTQGEILFEQYLATQRLEFEFEKTYPGKSKRPDYTIEWNDQPVIFDVKDFDPPENLPRSGAYDPYIGIREKINQGRDKFKEYKEFQCGLVLRNLGHPLVSTHEPYVMLGAMYGDSGFTIPVNTTTGMGDMEGVRRGFLGRGKMIRRNSSRYQNTTISAIITLSIIRPHSAMLQDAFLADSASLSEKTGVRLRCAKRSHVALPIFVRRRYESFMWSTLAPIGTPRSS